MKKRSRKSKPKKVSPKKSKEMKVPLWIVNGSNGLLALIIYNFILYLTKITQVGGLITKLEESSGYFYLNSAIIFGANKSSMFFILLGVFGLTFILGITIGGFIRRHQD